MLIDMKESVSWADANSTLIAVLLVILGVLGITGLIELMGIYYTYTH
jgi:hypothetical protein